jgi:hypothetical protein
MLRFVETVALTDNRLSKGIIALPDGVYNGLRAAYEIKLENGTVIRTIYGIRCTWQHPAKITVRITDGVVYEETRENAYILLDIVIRGKQQWAAGSEWRRNGLENLALMYHPKIWLRLPSSSFVSEEPVTSSLFIHGFS